MNLLQAVQNIYNEPEYARKHDLVITLRGAEGELLNIPIKFSLDGEWGVRRIITAESDPSLFKSINAMADAMGIDRGKESKKETVQ